MPLIGMSPRMKKEGPENHDGCCQISPTAQKSEDSFPYESSNSILALKMKSKDDKS